MKPKPKVSETQLKNEDDGMLDIKLSVKKRIPSNNVNSLA